TAQCGKGTRGNDEDRCPERRNAEVHQQTESGAAQAIAEGRFADQAGGDPLEEAHRRNVRTNVEEDQRIGDVEYACDETGNQDGLDEGLSWHEELCLSAGIV